MCPKVASAVQLEDDEFRLAAEAEEVTQPGTGKQGNGPAEDVKLSERSLLLKMLEEERGVQGSIQVFHNAASALAQVMLSRVYPMGSRVSSSNVSDELACRLWEAGVQMVALNLQTVDSVRARALR